MVQLSSVAAQIARLSANSLSGTGGIGAYRLSDLTDFGSNPGALSARFYVPAGMVAGAPLVVVLHGCTQTAGGYDHGAGWSQLADELGFALLFPQQERANNPNLCFNWFSPVDARRGSGEALSIHQMIMAMRARHRIDTDRIFITGLSAGGAMASIMLATYPEVFAGGAIIAGLPFGAARSVTDAFARMRGDGYPSDAELAAAIRHASDHKRRWPRISVWQGSADQTVAPSNADRIVASWRIVHGLPDEPTQRIVTGGIRHERWSNAEGEAVLEAYDIAGMGHGTPLRTTGPGGCGASGPFMLDVGLSSTRQIAQFWDLGDGIPSADTGIDPDRAAPFEPAADARASSWAGTRPATVGAVIADALRGAGLLR
ncbi:extracellular catalytic domain type 1 short-chain-length polyhydroxyalkanoate depolymerase [Novosphingobium rosa]